jgi:hypothetical protein
MIKLLGLYIWIKPFNNLPQVNITINLRYQQCTASMWFHVRTKNRVHTVHFVSHRVMPYIRKAMFLWGFHPTSQGSLSDFLFFLFFLNIKTRILSYCGITLRERQNVVYHRDILRTVKNSSEQDILVRESTIPRFKNQTWIKGSTLQYTIFVTKYNIIFITAIFLKWDNAFWSELLTSRRSKPTVPTERFTMALCR